MTAPETLSSALLLVLDMQPSLLAAIPRADALVARVSLAVEMARQFGLQVAFTEQAPEKLGSTLPSLPPLAMEPAVWTKTSFSALDDEAIAAAIRLRDIEHLIIVGIETPICVYQTTLSALADDMQVTLLTDAVGARRPEDADWALRALGRAGAHLLPVETVLYSLLGDAAHPRFRASTQLVKQYATS